MGQDIKLYTGSIAFKEKEFTYVFDGSILKLIPEQISDVFEIMHEEVTKGTYVPADPKIEESTISGTCNETGQKIIFVLSLGSRITCYNYVLELYPLAYILLNQRQDHIGKLSFTAKELDHIYPISQAYVINLTDEMITAGEFGVQSRSFKECTTETKHFNYENREISLYFSIARFLHRGNDKSPLQYSSSLSFEFDSTNDYLYLFKLCHVAYDFLRFLCCRDNINFTKISISYLHTDGLYRGNGEFILCRRFEEEEYPLKRELCILYSDLEGKEGAILQLIAEEKLYLRHIPENHSIGRSITPASFVMITSAFEWEYRQLFENGVPKSDTTKAAEAEADSEIQNLIDNSKGKKREIYKHLKKLISVDTLSSEIVHVSKELQLAIDPIAKHLYAINGTRLKYSQVGNRLAEQRNDYAHGNLDKDFNDKAMLDLMLLQRLIYIMQLKRVGISNSKAREAINHLYHLNLIFEEDKEELQDEKAEKTLEGDPQ